MAVRVLVAMSGGVDSSVAASLLVEAGHDVTGVTLRLWGGPSDSGCCSATDAADARRVAATLGVPHHVFDYEEEFTASVVDPYVAAHRDGRTPNPCVACNRHVKFDALLAAADRMGFEALATGHHARTTTGARGPELRRGADAAKDQSYVLGMLEAWQLGRLVLPVGEMGKEQVRAHAAGRGLATAAKPDSQDVCFISAASGRAGFLAERIELHPARVLEAGSGRDLGEVPAVELVTIGQGRGMGRNAEGQRRYVAHIDHQARTITAGPLGSIERDEVALDLGSLTWTGSPLPHGAEVLVQCAAHGPVEPVALDLEAGQLRRARPGRPVAPGQLAVLYDLADPDLVLGSAEVR